jgi:hypothetical protein
MIFEQIITTSYPQEEYKHLGTRVQVHFAIRLRQF